MDQPKIIYCDAGGVDDAISALGDDRPITVLPFDRAEIERGSIGAAIDRLFALGDSPSAVHRLVSSAILQVRGYDDDPRELFEVPECRTFFRSLAYEWGGWLYFLEKHGESIPVFLSFLLDLDVERRGGGVVSSRMRDPDQYQKVLMDLFRGMNALFEHHRLGDEACIKMTDEVMAAAWRLFGSALRGPR